MPKTVNLGAESDQELRTILIDVLRELGGSVIHKEWGVAGSQDVEALVVVRDRRITVEAETYIGLSVTGDETIVDEIAGRVSKARAGPPTGA